VSDGQAPDLRRFEKTLDSLDRTLHGGPNGPGLAWVVSELVKKFEKMDEAIYGKNGLSIRVHDHGQTLTSFRRLGWILIGVLAVQMVTFLGWALRTLLGVGM
jgi:hypothetical protein